MLRNLLNRMPRLKKLARTIAAPVIKWRISRQVANYRSWAKRRFIDHKQIARQRKEARALAYQPLISVIVPTYNTPEAFFREMADSVLAQTYGNWELVLVDDASPNARTREYIKRYAKKDGRIKSKFLTKNKQIAAATNEGIKIASGEFIALFDHDDVLQPDALFEVVKALNVNKNLDFIYTDEDKITDDTAAHHQPFFKPGWNPDLLRSINYITHFTTIRRSVLDSYGYENGKYNGTQDWELFLRITRNIPESHIHHIPRVLYSWRVHEGSTAKDVGIKPYVVGAQRRALEDDLKARRQHGFKVLQDEKYPVQWRIERRMPINAKVSIVVTGNGETYQHILNAAPGDYLVLTPKKLSVSSGGWAEIMLGDAAREDIGFVLAACRAEDVIKNLGHIIDRDALDFIMRSDHRLAAKHFYLTTKYNIRTVHSGVVMVSKEKLKRAVPDLREPFNIQIVSNYLLAAGYRNLYNPYVKVLK